MRLRLYLDEDVIPELARILRSQGDDVISAHEVGALHQYHRRELGILRRVTIALLESVSAEELRDSVYALDQYRSVI